MRMALEWLSPSHAAAAICTDSRSLFKAIQSGSADTADPGNEEADACAKQAASITDGANRPVSFAAASALIRRTLTDTSPCNCRIKEVYTKTFSWPADCRAVSKRRGALLLARLQAGQPPPPSSRLTPISLTL